MFLRDLLNTAQHRYENTSDSETLRSLMCLMIKKFFFEIATHVALDSNNLRFIYDFSLKLFESSPTESSELLMDIIKEPGKYFELLLKCPERTIRRFIFKTILGACSSMLKTNTKESRGLLENFIDVLISLIGYDLAVQWTKFKQFFKLLKSIVTIADEQLLRYIFDKDLVTCLLDFFLENDSPVSPPNTKRYEMGNASLAPDFGPLMETVSFLAMSTLEPWPNGPPPKLSDSAIKCLQCDKLITKFVRCNGKLASISKMIITMCYDNKKATKQLCSIILKGIDNSEISKAVEHIDLIRGMLLLKDQYQELRIELILGYPQPLSRSGYGLASINDIEEDVNCYFTPIRYTKSLLQFMWNEKKHTWKIVIKCIQMLYIVCGSSKVVYNYLKQMPPPCYLFARYTDWIPKFLESCFKSYTHLRGEELKEKNDLIEEVKELHEVYNAQVVSEEKVPPVFYMVGKVIDSYELPDKTIVRENVRLSVTEIVTEVYETKPMGDYNAGLSANYLIKHFNHTHGNANTWAENRGKIKRISDTNLLEIAMSSESPEKVKPGVNPEDSKELTELRKVKSKDSNPSIERVDSSEIEMGEQPTSEINQEQYAKPKSSPMVTEEKNADVDEIHKMEDIEKAQPINEDNPPKFFENSPNNLPTEQSMKSEEKEVEHKKLAVFHLIEIVNRGQIQVEVKMSIKPKSEDINFYCPITKCKQDILTYKKTLLTLQRIHLDRNIGDYEIDLDLKATQVVIPLPPQIPIAQPPSVSNNMEVQGRATMETPEEFKIACTACTFLNEPTLDFCAICDKELPKSPSQHA